MWKNEKKKKNKTWFPNKGSKSINDSLAGSSIPAPDLAYKEIALVAPDLSSYHLNF